LSDEVAAMNTAFEELVRDSMKGLTAEVGLPPGLAARARRRHRRRRLAQFTTIAAGAAGVAAVVTAVLAAPGAGGVTGPSGDQTTAYVIRRVDSALASGNLVMRESVSMRGGFVYVDGRRSYEDVTWSYRGDTSSRTFGAGGQLQADDGTALVDGKLRSVQVDYVLRQWLLSPPSPASTPATPCSLAGFMAAGSGDPTASWPALIRQELACGGYQVAGNAVVDGVRTIKITGSVVIKIPVDDLRLFNTIFVNPATYLPVRTSQYAKPVAPPSKPSAPSVVDFRWLPATAANVRQALVTIPPGFPQVQG
jgi:hypothetical protein